MVTGPPRAAPGGRRWRSARPPWRRSRPGTDRPSPRSPPSGSLPARRPRTHGWVRFEPVAPIEAVPVLPAMRDAADLDRRARALLDHLLHHLRHPGGGRGLHHLALHRGADRLNRLTLGLTTRAARCGVISFPPLATAAATIAICSGVTSIPPWPMPIRPMSSAGLAGGYGLPFGRVRPADVDLVRRVVERWLRVEAEALHVVGHCRRARRSRPPGRRPC